MSPIEPGQLKIEDYSLMFNERIIRIEDVNLTPLKEMITFQKAISLSVLSRRIG